MTEINPQITIIKDDTVSIARLAEAQRAGVSVLRSAHVGNLSPYNLGLAQEFPMLLVDHNQTGVDTTYKPESIISSDDEVPLVMARGQLSLRSYIDTVPEAVQDVAGSKGYLDQLHQQAIQKAIPDARLFTATNYLRANEAVTGEIVTLALREMPAQFSRVVTPNGAVEKRDASSLAARCGVLQLRDDPRAAETMPMIPNAVTIVANFVIEALQSGAAEQYHLSGPDMVNYATTADFQASLNQLYTAVKQRASFRTKLPGELVVRLVKSTPAKFVTTSGDRQQQLDDVLAHLADVDTIAAEKAAFFRTDIANDADCKSAFLQLQADRKNATETKLAEQLLNLPELLLQPGDTGMLTQYDVLQESALYVPTVNRELTMRQLEALSKRLATVKKRARR